MFIDTTDKGLINASLCRRIQKKRGELGVYTFVFSDSEWIDATPCHVDDIEKVIINNKVIAAAPGFALLRYDGMDTDYAGTPIIGWKGDFDFYVEPILVEGSHTWGGADGNDVAIKLPDGRVIDQYWERLFETPEEWVTSRTQQKARYAEAA